MLRMKGKVVKDKPLVSLDAARLSKCRPLLVLLLVSLVVVSLVRLLALAAVCMAFAECLVLKAELFLGFALLAGLADHVISSGVRESNSRQMDGSHRFYH